MPASWKDILSSPLVIALVVLIIAQVILFCIAPVLFKLFEALPKRIGFISHYPRRTLAVLVVLLILIFGSYVYYYFNQPVRIVTAAQLKLEKGRVVNKLQDKGLSSWVENRIYFLDIRSPEEYAAGHLKGSSSLPAERVAQEMYPMGKIDLVIYSTSSRFDEVRKAADSIEKKAKLSQYKGKSGKIYLIKDGFEGLEKAGLLTEFGIWD